MHDVDPLPGQFARLADRLGMRTRQAVDDAADDLGAAAGLGAPPAAARVIRSGMPPGAMNSAEVASIDQRRAGNAAAAWSSWSRTAGTPPVCHSRRHSLSSHSPVTFRRNRVVPSIPVSFVKFAAIAASVRTGAASSRPTRDQVPQEM